MLGGRRHESGRRECARPPTHKNNTPKGYLGQSSVGAGRGGGGGGLRAIKSTPLLQVNWGEVEHIYKGNYNEAVTMEHVFSRPKNMEPKWNYNGSLMELLCSIQVPCLIHVKFVESQ